MISWDLLFNPQHIANTHKHILNSKNSIKIRIEGFVKNENVTQEDFNTVLELMRETKSIEYTLDLARYYIEQAKSSIRTVTFPQPEYIKSLDARLLDALDE